LPARASSNKNPSKVLLSEYNARMAAKMGLQAYDKALAMELLKLMYDCDADFTNTFRWV
jgi:uncharacterized protein YdiU (UPF0061 family)